MNNFKVNYGPTIDYRLCVGCGECYNMCPMDIFGYDKEKRMPTVDYPAECMMCCYCETVCPEVAIDVHFPLSHMLDFGILPTQLSKKSRFLDE